MSEVLADTTFEAVVLGWDSIAAPDRGADAAAVRARVEALCAAGVHVVVVSGKDLGDLDKQLGARPDGPGQLLLCVNRGREVFEATADGPVPVWGRDLAHPRVTSDGDHVEVGLTDETDSVRWALGWLAARGITGGLVLVAGGDSVLLVAELDRAPVVSVGGGARRLLGILDAQLARRGDHRVPSVDPDPAWLVRLPTDPHAERVAEALGSLANGWAGTRASLEEHGPLTLPLFAVSGIYTAGPSTALLAGPQWDGLEVSSADLGAPGPPDQARTERAVDLRTGVLVRRDATGLRTFRFMSALRPEAVALRAEAPATRLRPGPGLSPPSAPNGTAAFERRRRHGADLARVHAPGNGGITVAARERDAVVGGRRVVERLAAWTAARSRTPAWSSALKGLDDLEGMGFDRLLAEHREVWASRWAGADVRIDGPPGDQLAARFAVFHLLGAAPDAGEAAVGARGLTGRAYGGHVFWDADVFVLPALAALRPAAARAMLDYRLNRLPAARAAAASRGRRGARFPWESAGDGTDVTPARVPGRLGELVPVLSGEEQEHIVGDVAWAACRYAAWTGDTAFLEGPGQALLVETARWWATGIRRDADGRAHIDGVMGPDEYHPVVDDNAYTNVLARWNLRRAADLVDATGGDPDEAAEWRTLADALVDGFDAERGLHEQFAGYWDLEPLLATQVATPPFAADLVLGAERVAGSQLLKQADVVMAHHILPDEMAPGSLAADLAHYEPRTAHGSSLSPAIYAAQLARARRPDDALDLFRLAARLDLDDLTGTTAGGLHLATLGGVWQALAHGFLGLDPAGEALCVDPCLPTPWQALELRFRFRGQAVGVRADRRGVRITCDAPLLVRLAGGPPQLCDAPSTRISSEAPG